MIVPHAAHVGVPPQWEDLSNDGHPAQRAVNELHDVCVAHFLKMERTERDISSVRTSVWLLFRGNVWKGSSTCCPSNRFCL